MSGNKIPAQYVLSVVNPTDGSRTPEEQEPNPPDSTALDVEINFYWRPGCGYCSRLERRLQGLGLPVTKHNIWEESDARSFVRSVANGNETVPVVQIGSWSEVNPNHGQVLAAARVYAPNLVPKELDAEGDGTGLSAILDVFRRK